jgi:hypothetical protein
MALPVLMSVVGLFILVCKADVFLKVVAVYFGYKLDSANFVKRS